MLGLIVTVLTGMVVAQVSSLEPSFGQNGTVRLENIRTKFIPKASLDVQGHIVLSGATENNTQTVVRLQADGQLDPNFGVRGVLRLKALGQIFVDHQKRVLVVQDKRILRFYPNGVIDSSYGQKGIFTFPTGTQKTRSPMHRVVLNPDGSIWAALIKTPRIISENRDDDDETPQLMKITNQGRMDVSVGNQGFTSTAIKYPNVRVDGLQRTSSGGVAMVSSGDFFSPAGVMTYERPIWIHRFNQKGQLEPQQAWTPILESVYLEFQSKRATRAATRNQWFWRLGLQQRWVCRILRAALGRHRHYHDQQQWRLQRR